MSCSRVVTLITSSNTHLPMVSLWDPTLRSPGVWPLKSEPSGECWDPLEVPPPEGHANYSSTKSYAAEIRATFMEEVDLGMVTGPLSKQQAAQICSCRAEDLCPCPMAGNEWTRSAPSLMDLMGVRMRASRPIPRRRPQLPQSWTASTHFTESKHASLLAGRP